ncbi:MAG: 50S ribosome-binding GTPase [Candidatus Omnitrophica bacterium]|nr:50S ribosome-binding GTPase [Candidatus Omnitrophota bacterium]
MRCCHNGDGKKEGPGSPRVVITGWPNVGKSVLFNQLTGRYVTVSNYPGTTVEVSRGHALIEDRAFEVIDTPGLYTLLPVSEEERVARRILLYEKPSLVVHVAEARNFEKMLPLTIQLIESSLPTLLVLNMMDEAQKAGVRLDLGHLEKNLGVPVVGTVGTKGRGVGFLKKRIAENAL